MATHFGPGLKKHDHSAEGCKPSGEPLSSTCVEFAGCLHFKTKCFHCKRVFYMPNLSNHLAKLLTREGNESQICPSKGTWTLIPRQLHWFLSPFLIFFLPPAFTMAFQKTCSPVHNWRILNRKTCSSKKWNTNQRLLSAMDAGFLTCNLPRTSVCTALFGTRQCVAMLPKKIYVKSSNFRIISRWT